MPIVAAVDRGEGRNRIVERGRELADAYDTELHVVHVLSQSDFLELERTSLDESGRAVEMDRIREIAREIATEAAEGVADDFTPVGLVGDAPKEILRYASENGAEYVVVGGRKRSPVGKALFGSVTQSVLLNAERPVVAVMAEPEEGE